ncbi:hypothetical protein INR49_008911 [Caranx melampygus]|nr:hypothetical protein INR49_008911 [Caranx melampygus]
MTAELRWIFLLLHFTVTEQEVGDDDEVTLNCSVRSYDGRWRHHNNNNNNNNNNTTTTTTTTTATTTTTTTTATTNNMTKETNHSPGYAELSWSSVSSSSCREQLEIRVSSVSSSSSMSSSSFLNFSWFVHRKLLMGQLPLRGQRTEGGHSSAPFFI